MIDGYSSVQAIRRLDGKTPRPKPPDGELSAVATSAGVSTEPAVGRPVNVAHTALPTRHDLICYACNYRFMVTGRLDKVLCPKCKTQLETGDKHIDGTWSGTIQTVGRVFINSGAVVSSARIVALDIRVAGMCRSTRLEPTRHLELDSGAQVELDKLSKLKIVILESASLCLDEPLRCRTLEVFGELQAEARPSEQAVLHPASTFRGTLHSPRLIVYEGAALKAYLHISPPRAAAVPVTVGNPPPEVGEPPVDAAILQECDAPPAVELPPVDLATSEGP